MCAVFVYDLTIALSYNMVNQFFNFPTALTASTLAVASMCV